MLVKVPWLSAPLMAAVPLGLSTDTCGWLYKGVLAISELRLALCDSLLTMTDETWETGAIFSGSFWLHNYYSRVGTLLCKPCEWMSRWFPPPPSCFFSCLSASKIFVWYSSVSNELGATRLDSKWIFFNICQFLCSVCVAATRFHGRFESEEAAVKNLLIAHTPTPNVTPCHSK